MSGALSRLVTGRPRLVLAVTLLMTLALVPVLARLRLDTDIYDLFPRDQPTTDAFARFSKAFIAAPVIVVLCESGDAARLQAFVDPFAQALRHSSHIAEVRHRLTGEAAAFFRDHLLSFLDDEGLEALRERTEPVALQARLSRLRGLLSAPGGSALAPLLTADPLELLPLVQRRMGGGLAIDAQSGLYRSADGHALLVYLRPRDASTDAEATRTLLEEIGALAAPLGGAVVSDGIFHDDPSRVELSFVGPSVYALHYRDWLHRDMTRSTVLSGLAVLILFGVFFRTLRVLPIVGLPLLCGLVWTGALAQLLYGRVNAVSLAFGTILISIGIDLPIQLYNRLREELCTHAPGDALRRTVERFAGPAVLATLGPAAVFAACTMSRFRGLRELGALAAIGLVVNCVAMLTIFPALLMRLPGRLWGARAVAVATGGPLRALGTLASRRPGTVLLLALALFALALPLAARVRFDRALFSQPPMMPPSRVQAEVGRRFGQLDGAAIAYVEESGLHASPEQLDERALQRSDRWLREAHRLRARGLLRGFQSLSALVPSEETQRARHQRLSSLDPPRRAAAFRAAADATGFAPSVFDGFLAQLVAPFVPLRVGDLPHELDFLVALHLHHDVGKSRLATYLYPIEGPREQEALAAIERVAAGPAGGVVTGRPLVEPALRRAAEEDVVRASALAAALVVLLVVLYHRRLRESLCILLPLALAWALFGAALWVFRIPLNLYNLLAVPLVIGYGIDDHVFLQHRFDEGGRRDVGEALASTGRAVIVTSLATVAGFLPIAFARFPALRLLGVSGALAVGLCLFAAFAVLPALLVVMLGATRAPENS
jgi:predicted RND superfamily exporter protein